MDVSVVVCHHIGRDLLLRCLDSVFASRNIHYEVILISSDITLGDSHVLDRYEGLRWYNEQGGPAHKRNFGTLLAKADYIAYLDDDVEVSPYCLYNLKKGLEEHPKAGMGFAKILNMERRNVFDDCGSWLTGTGFLWARASNGLLDIKQFDEAIRCLASKSATCIVARKAFYSAGGFDADYYILGEETDIAWRMWLKGWEVWYLPQAVSWHAFGTSLKPTADYYTLARIHYHGCKNYLNLLLTNLGLLRLVGIIPIHVGCWLAATVGFALRGEFLRSRYILQGIWWNIINWRKTLAKRRHVQSGRVVGDKQLFRIVLHNPPVSYYTSRLWRYWTTQLHG